MHYWIYKKPNSNQQTQNEKCFRNLVHDEGVLPRPIWGNGYIFLITTVLIA